MIETSINNLESKHSLSLIEDHIVKCLACGVDLLVPKGCLHVYCGACGHTFKLPKNYYSKAEYLTNIYEYIDQDY